MSSDCLTNTPYRQWEGCGSDAVLLLVHGLGGHTGRWEPLGDFLAAGASVLMRLPFVALEMPPESKGI